VQARVPNIDSVALVPALQVPFKTSFNGITAQLPQKVKVVYDTGAEEELSVVWESEDFDNETADRKSTRLNSSHVKISYAVFCFSRYCRTLHSLPTRRSSDLSTGKSSKY